VIRWLSDEPNIAFLLANGPKRWKAVQSVDRLADGRHGLWQHTGDPLVLLRESGVDAAIANPWAGWQEARTGADPSTPYFGAGHPSVFWLNLRTSLRPYSSSQQARWEAGGAHLLGAKDVLSLSSFEWIGNGYGKAPQPTHRCWQRLRNWVRRTATQLATAGESLWAFPSALAKLQGGIDYSANGQDLTAALQALNRPAGQ